ncbi:MAG TPA: prepilin peptidase [Hypericibacter adhaerens]|jgi:prepilin peptidase CpaA|uniref:Pilus assembly protein CpaA n=1 Tax=Hypericibacter adhaerens TaxID=2602016 RepID=A0A5J6N6B2_9PROT|nr:prepilin peptidase [Hypericibacter adhaerens]QEX22466.1 pilus assembly protein CpaA [Hypericibacter adhaerens]HWA41725.1 prepilin peptidase [Hypericibacter adhaerens]
MLSPVVHLLIIACFAGLLLFAAAQDLLWLKLPNRLSLAILLLYPGHVLVSPVPVEWQSALILAAFVLAGGIFCFFMGWAGGGDAKLFTVVSLWAGPGLFPLFLLLTGVAGGVIAAVLLARRHLAPRFAPRWAIAHGIGAHAAVPSGGATTADPAARRLERMSLPYGVAIAFGGLAVAVSLLMQG